MSKHSLFAFAAFGNGRVPLVEQFADQPREHRVLRDLGNADVKLPVCFHRRGALRNRAMHIRDECLQTCEPLVGETRACQRRDTTFDCRARLHDVARAVANFVAKRGSRDIQLQRKGPNP